MHIKGQEYNSSRVFCAQHVCHFFIVCVSVYVQLYYVCWYALLLILYYVNVSMCVHVCVCMCNVRTYVCMRIAEYIQKSLLVVMTVDLSFPN